MASIVLAPTMVATADPTEPVPVDRTADATMILEDAPTLVLPDTPTLVLEAPGDTANAVAEEEGTAHGRPGG